MRILVAPQEFKGSLTAVEAADAVARGVKAADPTAEIDLAPMSDGGPGLVDALVGAAGGSFETTAVHDPLMRDVRARWARLSDGSAVIEMAAASGLVLVAEHERAPLVATTYGTGELVRAALDGGCSRIILGIGGSATVDAGAGAMQALGARLLDAHGADLPRGGGALRMLERIEVSDVDARLGDARILVAADVTSTLCGPAGAARMFGRQKGATDEDIETLEASLLHFADIAQRQFGIDLLSTPGTGAAGGLAAGLMLIAATTIEPGFDLVAHAVGLERRVAEADLVITGEGKLDEQSAHGKTVGGIASMARRHGKPVVAIAGVAAPEARGGFDAVVALTDDGTSIEAAMRDAHDGVANATERALRAVMKGG
ncbi:MAG TPA: glycerate kinase [Dehalococcoidia bacterium]|jgi:glycerate kinase